MLYRSVGTTNSGGEAKGLNSTPKEVGTDATTERGTHIDHLPSYLISWSAMIYLGVPRPVVRRCHLEIANQRGATE